MRCFGCSPAQVKTGPRKKHAPPIWRATREASCSRCGKAFKAKLPRERFCSRVCQSATRNRLMQERARNRSPRPCKVCGEVFAPAYGDLRRLLCSTECARRARHGTRTGDGHRRRARLYGVPYERVNRLQVFERDGWHCKICGVATPRALMGSLDPNAPELDHVLPLSMGGPHTAANTQCACRRCNQAKGGRNRVRRVGI